MSQASSEESPRDRVRRLFHTMKDFDLLAAQIPEGTARAALPGLLSEKFGVPAHGTDGASLARLFTFCRLKLDTYADTETMRSFFVETLCHALDPLAVPAEPAAYRAAVPASDTVACDEASSSPIVKNTINAEDGSKPVSRTATTAVASVIKATPEDRILFPGQPAAGELPIHYPALLLPCPDGGRKKASRSRWLSGEIWGHDAVVIGFGDLSHRSEERMADAEAEMAADPVAYAERNDIRMMRADTLNNAPSDWLAQAAQGGSVPEPSEPEVTRALRDAFAKAVLLYSPDHATTLAGLGARIEVGKGAAASFAQALRVEQSLLMDWDDGENRRAQMLLGAPHPDRAIGPGTALARSAITHMLTGRQLADCLIDGLAELRLAQVLRGLDEEEATLAMIGFDQVFLADCQAPLESYRFAKKGMEMAV